MAFLLQAYIFQLFLYIFWGVLGVDTYRSPNVKSARLFRINKTECTQNVESKVISELSSDKLTKVKILKTGAA